MNTDLFPPMEEQTFGPLEPYIPEGAVEVLRKSIGADGHAVSIVFESQEAADRFHARLSEDLKVHQNFCCGYSL